MRPVNGRSVVHRLRRLYWRLARPTTLGVRCLVVRDGRVLLVRHSYERWWYLPGGGVERGESFGEAARREVAEETGLSVGPLRVFHAYLNCGEGKIDHVVVFCAEAADGEPRADGAEIRDVGFFPPDAPPADTSPATRRRLAEYAGVAPLADRW
jgi:ADP-ribose pyrophosphatase YjhB (NUDIX family)